MLGMKILPRDPRLLAVSTSHDERSLARKSGRKQAFAAVIWPKNYNRSSWVKKGLIDQTKSLKAQDSVVILRMAMTSSRTVSD
jgi:hypothetical protein